MSGLEEAVLRNIAAVGEMSEIVRTSFGPNGMFCIEGCRRPFVMHAGRQHWTMLFLMELLENHPRQ